MQDRQVTFFDFDETLTQEHTFSEKKIELFNGGYHGEDIVDEAGRKFIYEEGKRHAQYNTKKDVPFKHNDHEQLSAIVTHHNNPHFIAGYIAHITNKELTFVATHTDPTCSYLVVNEYQIEGVETPFYISYIPAIIDEDSHEYIVALDVLEHNKNKQISFLRNVLLERQLINAKTNIHFYDDMDVNILAASQLQNMSLHCHWVDSKNTTFAIKTISRGQQSESRHVQQLKESKPQIIISKNGINIDQINGIQALILLKEKLQKENQQKQPKQQPEPLAVKHDNYKRRRKEKRNIMSNLIKSKNVFIFYQETSTSDAASQPPSSFAYQEAKLKS